MLLQSTQVPVHAEVSSVTVTLIVGCHIRQKNEVSVVLLCCCLLVSESQRKAVIVHSLRSQLISEKSPVSDSAGRHPVSQKKGHPVHREIFYQSFIMIEEQLAKQDLHRKLMSKGVLALTH